MLKLIAAIALSALAGIAALFAPKGTPREIVAHLNGAMMQALADPTVRTRFTDVSE